MRVPVFSQNSNPLIDPRLCNKSESYCTGLVLCGRAKWLDMDNKRKGCIAIGRIQLRPEEDYTSMVEGSGFDTAWGIRQSGFAGPLVWQLKTMRASL